MVCLDPTLPLLDLANLESPLLLHSSACLGLAMFIFKYFRFDSSVSILDALSMGLTLFLQSFARLESFFPVFGLSCSGFLPPILDLVMMEAWCLRAVLLALACCCQLMASHV